MILYASHIFGCVWWVTSRYDDDESWWERDGLDIDDALSTYIASLYWAATTITTVSKTQRHEQEDNGSNVEKGTDGKHHDCQVETNQGKNDFL